MTEIPKLPANPEKEPALRVGATTGTVAGVLSLLMAVAPDLLTDKQMVTILIVGAFILPILQGIWTRSTVWSPATVKELIDKGIADAQKELENKKPVIKNPDDSEFFKRNL